MSPPTVTSESPEIQHLKGAYPRLHAFFQDIGNVNLPTPSQMPVVDAVILHIVGQMLSAKAAATIHGRLLSACTTYGCSPWHLNDSTFRECGLSRRKTRTIREFGVAYEDKPQEIELWRTLTYADLLKQVRSFWGLSDWTAAMLAIFHFGQRDIFPLSDSSLARVIRLLENQFLDGQGSFDPKPASPFGTQLAMICWASLDRGYWQSR